jgi:PTH1 family peptidyl-tRNA hydrolase
MKVVLGLGNIGDQYKNTRHNAGFIFVDYLAEKLSCPDWVFVDKFKADATSGFYNKEKVILVKPRTYMNLSGITAERVVDFYKVEDQDFMVVYDDIDLPLGSFRIRAGGSAGTHNGARSIKNTLGPRGFNFRRIRLGIDTKTEADYERELSSFVLGKMSEDELKILNRTIASATEALLFSWEQGMAAAMQVYNKK